MRSFRNAATRAVFERRFLPHLPNDIQPIALRKLRMLHNAAALDDLRSPPGNRLEKLAGQRAGQCGIRINDQWRVCFHWRDGDVHDAEICDYH